ncbi:Inositol-phosphate phosphatase [Methylobacterium sp. 4-46]|uniref:inositol monophosphatase family protein n=1 Tax=unclassified Methylobacterium TaxID=2615210 RepID=UPI000152C82B|nr:MULTISPECIES: inositol monophosphatase [Methylobacterium]ACA16997.1 Inositol-phosphate phosphatase [Methylobacterium sp. 4-46]WFT82686.1 inositol monophosphatase [Methylobacterium nodulans]
MPSPSHDPRRFALAQEIARRAAEKAQAFFAARDTLVVERKSSPQDLVSRADREVEVLIRELVAASFPDDAVLGEEEGLSEGRSGFVWVVDPIDGTSPFLHGQPNWCVSVALAGAGGIEAGVIAAPVLGETYAAARGAGATLNGRPLAIEPSTRLTSGSVAYGATARTRPAAAGAFVERLYAEGGTLFNNGSGALMLAYVAAGRLAGYYDPGLSSWDCYAGLLLVEEAGGAAEFDGDLRRRGALRAGSKAMVEDLRRLSAGLDDAVGTAS